MIQLEEDQHLEGFSYYKYSFKSLDRFTSSTLNHFSLLYFNIVKLVLICPFDNKKILLFLSLKSNSILVPDLSELFNRTKTSFETFLNFETFQKLQGEGKFGWDDRGTSVKTVIDGHLH